MPPIETIQGSRSPQQRGARPRMPRLRKALRNALLAVELGALAAVGVCTCRGRGEVEAERLERRMEEWKDIEYGRRGGKCGDGYGPATSAYFETRAEHEKARKSGNRALEKELRLKYETLEPLLDKMRENRDNGKRADWCRGLGASTSGQGQAE